MEQDLEGSHIEAPSACLGIYKGYALIWKYTEG